MRRFSLAVSISIFFLIVFLLAVPSAGYAQSASSASIVGVVTDQQGDVVPNIDVTATNVATGVAYRAKTTSSGNYIIPNLPPGTYTVRMGGEKTGFAPAEAKNVQLNVGDQRDLNVKLSLGSTAQTIEVSAEAPLIETTKTDVSTSVTALDMERLPTFAGAGGVANDYAQLALTAPGVKVDTSGISNTIGQGDLIGPGSINNRDNLVLVDGADIISQVVSGRFGLGASVDEVQEFQVLSNTYNAEYGQAGGLILNVATKSGTNGIHGDGHMYFRGRNLEASNTFYNMFLAQNAAPRGTTQPAGTPYCPAKDFSGGKLISLAGCDRAPFHRKEGGFTLGGPFIKDKLFWFTSYELSRQASPLTLTPATGAVNVPQAVNNLLYSGKIDYHISDKHNLSARYNVDRQFLDNQIVQTSTSVTPDSLTSQIDHVATLNVGLASSISPTLVNEARFIFVRNIGPQTNDKTTKPGVVHSAGYLSGADFCCPQGAKDKRYGYIDNVTWTHSKHTFKGGFSVSYYPWFSLFPQFHFGQYTFNDAKGIPTAFTYAVGPGQVTSKDNVYGFYFQDTWKITNKLTMNAGIRYDFEAGAFKGGKIKGPNGTCFQGNGLIPACSSDGNNWQPRLGFTYAPFQNTLIKAAFGEITALAYNNIVLDSLNFDGTTLNTVTTTNPAVLAAYPNAPNPALLTIPPGSTSFGRVRPISTHLKDPEVRHFTFGIQHEFTKTLSAEVDYVGAYGFGLFGERDTNAPPVIADPAHAGYFYFGNRPNTHFTAIRTNENSRTSHFNGLVLSATKRYSDHVQFNASYMWSHAIDSGEDFFGISEPGDPSNIRGELGPALNDIRHMASFSVVLDSGKISDNRYTGFFTNNLGLDIVSQLQSGRPYPVSTGTAGFSNARFFGAGNETQQRPDVLADGTISTAGIAAFDGANVLLGPGAVTACMGAGLSAAQCAAMQNTFLAPGQVVGVPCTPGGPVSCSGAQDSLNGDIVDFKKVNGDLERDAGLSLPTYRFDVSLKKTFNVAGTGERVKLELQADAFNIFNHPNYLANNANDITAAVGLSATKGVPNSDFFSCTGCMRPNGTIVGNGGQVLHVADMRRGKVSSNLLNPVFGTGPLAGIGDPSFADIPRTFQLSFHVRF